MGDYITYEEALKTANTLTPEEVYFLLDRYYEDCALIRALKKTSGGCPPSIYCS